MDLGALVKKEKLTNKQILEKAIQKAIENGWNTTHFSTLKANYKHPEDSEFHDLLGDWHMISPLDVIYGHDFAKALWGDEPSLDFGTGLEEYYHWQFRLMEMVIADDPIKYLGDHLDG